MALSQEEDVPAEALKYLNRLSDAFFVWSRYVCKLESVEEVLWQPNKPAESQQLATRG